MKQLKKRLAALLLAGAMALSMTACSTACDHGTHYKTPTSKN